MTWLSVAYKYVSYLWNNPVTRGILFALTAVVGLAFYGLMREREGRQQAEKERKLERAENRAKLEEKQAESVKQASEIRDDARDRAERVPDEPLEPWHYRDHGDT